MPLRPRRLLTLLLLLHRLLMLPHLLRRLLTLLLLPHRLLTLLLLLHRLLTLLLLRPLLMLLLPPSNFVAVRKHIEADLWVGFFYVRLAVARNCLIRATASCRRGKGWVYAKRT